MSTFTRIRTSRLLLMSASVLLAGAVASIGWAAPASAVNDTTAPIATTLMLASPLDNADTSVGDVVFEVSVHLTDAQSGVNGGSISCTSEAPARRSIDTLLNGVSEGTTFDGTWRSSFQLHRYFLPGAYAQCTVSARDEAGNISNTVLTAPSPVTIQGIADVAAPTATGIALSDPTGNRNTTLGPVSVPVSVSATDAGVGAAAFLVHCGPDLETRISTLSSGSATQGTWAGTLIVPRYSNPTTYKSCTVTAWDAADNGSSPKLLTSTKGVTTTGIYDASTPWLRSIHIGPADGNSDTSIGSVSFPVDAFATDVGQGVANIQLSCRVMDDPTRSYGASLKALASGTPNEGVWAGTIAVPLGAAPVRLQQCSFYIVDLAGNYGTGSISSTTSALSGVLPSPPTQPTVTPDDRSATIAWLKPASGSSPITGYMATATPGGQSCTADSPDALSCTIYGLTNGVSYTFTVVARSAVGASTPTTGTGTGSSDPGGGSSSVTVGNLPSAPVVLAPEYGSDGTEATLAWLAAESDPVTPVIGYRATATPGTAFCATEGALTCTITGLDPSASYTFHVIAINSVGSGGSGIAPTDSTPPVVTPVRTPAANAAGWNRTPVVISWNVSDPDDDSSTITKPDSATVTTEGVDQVVTSTPACDRAGNCASASTTVSLDQIKPTITSHIVSVDGSAIRPNADGWYSQAIRATWSCADELSGIASCPADSYLSTDGTNQVATVTATDQAGNATSTTIDGINIDSAAPTSTITTPCDSHTCAANDVAVSVAATDALSGVATSHVMIDGEEQVFSGVTGIVHLALEASSGTKTITYWSVDRAGNVERRSDATVSYDNVAPSITHTVTPLPNASGWNSDTLRVHFVASDDGAGSGIDYLTSDQTVDTETLGTVVSGLARDKAGNTATDSVEVRLDKTNPTIGSSVSGTRLPSGAFEGPVTVSFTCADEGSGIASCPDPTILTKIGSSQSASGVAMDAAGNAATLTTSGITIVAPPPSVAAMSLPRPLDRRSGGFSVTASSPVAISKVVATYTPQGAGRTPVVVEGTLTASSSIGGGTSYQFLVPPPPGVNGRVTVSLAVTDEFGTTTARSLGVTNITGPE